MRVSQRIFYYKGVKVTIEYGEGAYHRSHPWGPTYDIDINVLCNENKGRCIDFKYLNYHHRRTRKLIAKRLNSIKKFLGNITQPETNFLRKLKKQLDEAIIPYTEKELMQMELDRQEHNMKCMEERAIDPFNNIKNLLRPGLRSIFGNYDLSAKKLQDVWEERNL